MALRDRDRQSGQASVEHVAVVLLVSLVLGGGAVAADALGARSGIGDTVRRALGRAICLAGGGGATCDADREACLVRSDAREDGRSVHLAVIRVGTSSALVVEEMSDGTFRVTRIADKEGGLAFAHGGSLDVRLGARELALGDEVQAAILGHLGDADTWTVQGRREADALVSALKQGRPHRAPDARADEHGWSVSFGGGVSRGPVGAGITLSAKDVYGTRVDRATGRRIVYVRPSRDAEATLTLTALEGKAGAGGTELYAVTLDRAGVAVELSVLRSGSYRVSADLPRSAQAAVGLLGLPKPRVAREYAVETRLALASEADRRLASAFIDQVVHPDVIHTGAPVAVSRALQRRLDEAGIADARVYAVEEGGFGADGRIGVRGVALGGSIGIGETRKARLVAATSRGPDGVWYRREDCVTAGQGRA